MNTTPAPLRILAIEPYYGGSHKAFLDGLVRHSRHRFELFTLPARKWKWRMRGAAINAVQYLRANPQPYDLVFASDFLSMADFAGMCPPPMNAAPRIAYFHENQFSYPEQPESARDYQYLFTNVTTCLAAHRVFFNSHYHRTSFIRETDAFLRRMPDCVPEGIPREIEARSAVLHVGCELSECDAAPPAAKSGPLVMSSGVSTELMVFDSTVHGKGARFGCGTMGQQGLQNWTTSEQWLSWTFRINETATFDLSLSYNTQRDNQTGKVYLEVGQNTFELEYSAFVPLIEKDEHGNLRPCHSTLVAGKVTLSPGIHNVRLTPGGYTGDVLMQPLSVTLTPCGLTHK